MIDPGFRCAAGQVPVFPLPSVVFFPRTVLPLHVFEPRYRALVTDAAAGEGLVVISLLLPGWETDYQGNPGFHEVGTVGRIQRLDPLPEGRFDLRLVGLCRVRLGEVTRWNPYRTVRVDRLEETQVDESCPRISAAKLDLLASHGCLLRELMPDEGHGLVLDEGVSFEAAVNGTCANLPVDAAVRQKLLEENDLRSRQQKVSAILDEALERVLRLKVLRLREEGGVELN